MVFDKVKRRLKKLPLFSSRDAASKYGTQAAEAPLGSPKTPPNSSNEHDSKEPEKTLWQLAYDKIDEDLRKKYQDILDEACPNGIICVQYLRDARC